MTLPVLIRPRAEADMSDAKDWYNNEREGLGDEFVDAVFERLTRIQQLPLAFPIVHKDVRRCLMPRFPYSIFFRIKKTHIAVTAVYHNSRNPRGWQSRR